MNVSVVYMTAGSMNEAERIAKTLVQQQLAACVNIIDGMRSVYEWHGILQEDHEVVMIAKTRSDRLTDLMDAVKALHSYECPCILEFKVSDGNSAFLDWIDSRVGSKSPEA